MKKTYLLAGLLCALLVSCGPTPSETTSLPAGAITADDLARHIRILASDEFGGRGPSSPGEDKTIAYIKAEFERLGLEPGNGDSYFQPVPLVSITADPDTSITITGGKTPLNFAYDKDMMAWTTRVVDRVAVEDSDMVFVGYGIVAPEYGWDDYDGIDVRGKTVVILVNDPGYATQDKALFDGNAMTYYGRWTYKYEEAARHGAAAALVIHERKPAAYPWAVVTGSWSGPQFDLARADRNMSRVAVEGWLTRASAEALFAAAGLDLDDAKRAALGKDFKAMPLGLKASVALANSIKETASHNVVAVLPGAERPDEYVIYMAHWDHLGTDPAMEGDGIYNGALDNASGTAALLELAEAFASLDPPPARSVVFLSVTAEEQGLLGSAHYADNPLFPLAQTVAGINMDGLNNIGRTQEITVVGQGKSELEAYLARAAAKQGRRVDPEPFPENGYYYRSDHFNLAKKGVPMLYTSAGIDSVAHGVEWGKAQADKYIAERYHKPADEFDDSWDLAGGVEDVMLFKAVGLEIANSDAWPNWNKGTEFRALRDASRGTE